jgi:hypothetical protein
MRLKLGGWYYFKVSDHAKDGIVGDEVTLEVCGQVEKITDSHIHLIYWRANSAKGDTEMENANHERATLAISTIIRKKRLVI